MFKINIKHFLIICSFNILMFCFSSQTCLYIFTFLCRVYLSVSIHHVSPILELSLSCVPSFYIYYLQFLNHPYPVSHLSIYIISYSKIISVLCPVYLYHIYIISYSRIISILCPVYLYSYILSPILELSLSCVPSIYIIYILSPILELSLSCVPSKKQRKPLELMSGDSTPKPFTFTTVRYK